MRTWTSQWLISSTHVHMNKHSETFRMHYVCMWTHIDICMHKWHIPYRTKFLRHTIICTSLQIGQFKTWFHAISTGVPNELTKLFLQNVSKWQPPKSVPQKFGTIQYGTSSSLCLKTSIWSNPRKPSLQPCPRATLESWNTDTLLSLSVSFSRAVRSDGYSDWSIG